MNCSSKPIYLCDCLYKCDWADFIGKPASCAFFGIHNPGKFVRYKLLIPKTIQLTYKTFVPNPIKRF